MFLNKPPLLFIEDSNPKISKSRNLRLFKNNRTEKMTAKIPIFIPF